MTTTFILYLMMLLCAMSLFAMWHILAVINHMGKKTHHGVRWGYVLKATGLFMLVLSALDYLHGNPLTWPWLLLVGVTLLVGGIALLLVATRRACRCPECPVRKAVSDTLCKTHGGSA